MIKRLAPLFITLSLPLSGMEKIATDVSVAAAQSTLTHCLKKKCTNQYDEFTSIAEQATTKSLCGSDTLYEYNAQRTPDTLGEVVMKPYAQTPIEYSWNQKTSPSDRIAQIPATQEEIILRNFDTGRDQAFSMARRGDHRAAHTELCQKYNTTTEFLVKCTEKTDSKHRLSNIIRNAQDMEAGLKADFELMADLRQRQGLCDENIWSDYQTKEKLENESLNKLTEARENAQEKLNNLTHEEAEKKSEKFDKLTTEEQFTKLDDLIEKYQKKAGADAQVCENRIQHAVDTLAQGYIEKQKNKSLTELNDEVQKCNQQLTEHRCMQEQLELDAKTASKKEFKKIATQWKHEQVYGDLESAKLTKLEQHIQQKKFTPEYQEQLQKIKKELEYRGNLTPTEAKRLHAITNTLANNGTVSELDSIENPAEIFVGNEFEKQLYQESLNTLTQVADLNAAAGNNQQISPLTQQAENNSLWAMEILQDNQNPALAGAVAEVAAGFIKQAQAASIAQQHPESNATTATNGKISETDIAHFAEKAADATGEFGKGFALGAWQEVKETSAVLNQAITHPEQTAQKVIDNAQEALDNYYKQKQDAWQSCTGDGKTIEKLLQGSHPDALALFQTQMRQYQEEGYSAHAAEAFVVSDILSAQKTEQSWKKLGDTVKNATPEQLGALAGRAVAGTLLLDGGMHIVGGELAIVKAGGQSALYKADNTLNAAAESAKNVADAAKDVAQGAKQAIDDTKLYKIAGTDLVVDGKTLREMESLGQQALKRDLGKVGRSGAAEASREVFLDRVQTFEQARNKALEMTKLGQNSTPYICRLKKSAGYGKVTGRVSADRQLRWRLDYDPAKGIHINVEDFRGPNKKNYVIPFNGSEKDFKNLIKHLNR